MRERVRRPGWKKGLFEGLEGQAQAWALSGSETCHRLLHVYFFPPRKAKVCNLGGQVLSNQHISGSQVPVDELQAMPEVRD